MMNIFRRHPLVRVIWASLLLFSLLAGSYPPVAAHLMPYQQAVVGDKLVLAFYYMWYSPADFGKGQMLDRPVASYDSGQPETVERQVREARDAGIDGFIASWSGIGTDLDAAFAHLLDTSAKRGFSATIYFETNLVMQRGDVATQLQSALAKYSGHPAFLKWNGKPVVFFWSPQSFGASAA